MCWNVLFLQYNIFSINRSYLNDILPTCINLRDIFYIPLTHGNKTLLNSLDNWLVWLLEIEKEIKIVFDFIDQKFSWRNIILQSTTELFFLPFVIHNRIVCCKCPAELFAFFLKTFSTFIAFGFRTKHGEQTQNTRFNLNFNLIIDNEAIWNFQTE